MSLPKDRVAEEFDACLEAVIARAADPRVAIVVQMMAASVESGKLVALQGQVATRPETSPERSALGLQQIAEQWLAAAQQAVALDLDRTVPLRILGIGGSACTTLFAAATLGHEAVAVCRGNFLNNALVRLYQLARHEPKAKADLPAGQFDLVVADGNLKLGTKKGWIEFIAPLRDRMAEQGRLFVTLQKEPNPKRDYYPDIALSKLAAAGARVSSKAYFVLLDGAVIERFLSGAPAAAAAAVAPAAVESDRSRPDDAPVFAAEPQDNETGVSQGEPAAGPQPLERGFWPMKSAVVLLGGVAILLGLLAATWAGR